MAAEGFLSIAEGFNAPSFVPAQVVGGICIYLSIYLSIYLQSLSIPLYLSIQALDSCWRGGWVKQTPHRRHGFMACLYYEETVVYRYLVNLCKKLMSAVHTHCVLVGKRVVCSRWLSFSHDHSPRHPPSFAHFLLLLCAISCLRTVILVSKSCQLIFGVLKYVFRLLLSFFKLYFGFLPFSSAFLALFWGEILQYMSNNIILNISEYFWG